ncbi:transposase [Microcoleus sp. CAWBG58]|uniref:IS110 family transposase n=1 Tax=Microcoleus sp. CAWBG58 TaxID=2841651 RepID=UPI0025D1204E|nr:transposase [Microcoleus sp. CAWBG58]
MKYLILGIDVSRSSIAVCFMLEKPASPRDDYFDADIEVFHSNLENLNKLRAKIESFGADKVIAICEPTGINYAKLWVNKLTDWGAEMRMISNSKLPNYRADLMGKEGKSGAKTDDIDAFAIACWYFDKPKSSYLKIRDPLVSQVKQICLRIEHLNRVQSPIINRMRQELTWQCPEIAQVRSAKLQEELPPLMWGWLAGRRKSKKYDRILKATVGSGIESQTRWAASQYCEIEEEIFKLKKQLVRLIEHPQFTEYRRIFTKFGFGYQLQGYLLGAIYPIEDFLKDGRPEVKIRKNRQTGKKSKLKLSERRFMRAVGMGVIRDDSGQRKKGKQSGCALCRKALWQWCFTRLEVRRNNPPLKFVYGQGDSAEEMSPAEIFRRRKRQKGGTPIKLARQRVIARCIRELFKELCGIVKI